MNFHLSIRVKLFLSILLAILFSYTILLFLTIHSIENTFENRISRELDTNLRFIRYQLFTGANQLRYVLLFPSSRPQVTTYLQQRNEKELFGVLKSIQKTLPFLNFASFVDPQGRVIASLVNRKTGPFELDGLLKTVSRKRETVLSFELVDKNIFCRKGESCSSGQPGESVLAAAVAFPILNETGVLLGSMVATVPVNISNIIPNQIQEVLEHDLETGITLKNLKVIQGSNEDIVIPAETAEVILPIVQKGKTYRGEVRFGKTLYNTAFEPITNSQGEFIGALSVALSKEHFTTMRRDYFGGTMASAIFATLLAFIIAYFSSRWLASPLKELSKGVQCIEEGNLDFRVAIDATGEFGMLADSFNRMADALRERDTTIRNKTFDLEMLNRCLYEMNELLESNVKERTAELEMEKGRLEAILASMAEGIVVTDGNNRVILFNSAAQRIFGIAPYKMIGRHVEDIDVKGEFHQLVQGLRDVKGEDLLVGNEKEVKVGRKKLRVSLSPFLDQSLDFAGVVMSIRDVTHEEEVDRMKTEFISTVSHELKTPLTSMKGSLQLILGKGEGLTETERELIRVCHRNTDRLIRLINDILDISKIEAGRVDLNLKPESISRLVAYSLEELAAFARENGVTLESSMTSEGVPVLGDHDRLIQVLTNLLSNAVKFSPSGKTVTVTAHRDGDFMQISVIDEGKTIERADREMLFQKFPQLRGGQAKEFGGTGLGLAICKEIVERHHGRISYQAGKTGGNIFSFTIPVCGENP
ncbi:MAG: HAMP domain-containing protein [Geobacter sp.]|nr:MAG: HAMP domain-containing protein [Geobacter sp.]